MEVIGFPSKRRTGRTCHHDPATPHTSLLKCSCCSCGCLPHTRWRRRPGFSCPLALRPMRKSAAAHYYMYHLTYTLCHVFIHNSRLLLHLSASFCKTNRSPSLSEPQPSSLTELTFREFGRSLRSARVTFRERFPSRRLLRGALGHQPRVRYPVASPPWNKS